ncbi:MAG: TlyA family RNA methyltransferase [Coriobacteriales bacterium]|jgi:23S rRNA (cytidine1920-2'-O)/16S rRNA (cytidine1409-2'-O)-methyltransferase|nr:TlyA family RNA methyltransferase [Coriobacteriales bacterium]
MSRHRIPKEQLQDLLVRRGLAETRAQAERIILAGQVWVNGEKLTQAGAPCASDVAVELRGGRPYVSRGGLKLEGALKDFSFAVSGQNCIDVGASSGGFTDCLLKAGAQSVTAVDVGYGQFDWGLRQCSSVTLFERTHIARVAPELLGAPFDLLVADLSFTSLARLAPELAALLREQGSAITLVKPQFELPKAAVKHGVVRSFDLHVQALESVLQAYQNTGLVPQRQSFSRFPGPKGNIEFWIWAVKQGARATIDVEETVRRAHEELSVSQ